MLVRLKRIAAVAVPAAVFLAIVLALCWRLWTPIEGARRAFNWDSLWEYWGDLQFPADALRAGQLPLWNPFDRAGYPFHADPQAGLLYPPNWILWAIGALAGSGWWLVALKVIFHVTLAGAGVYALCRRHRVGAAPSYAAGVLFIFSYPFTAAIWSALNWSMAWAPWVILAIDVWAERPRPSRAAAVALAVGACVLAGAAASAWYTLIVAVPYAVWAVVNQVRARSGTARSEWWRAALTSAAIAAGLLAAMLIAQVTATGQLVGQTVREHRDLEFIGTTAFNADDLLGMIVPRMPGEGCYVGLATIMWAIAAVTLRPSPRRLVLGSIAVAGILFAWGNTSPFLPLSASAAAPFGFFRRAHRYLYVTMLPLALLGAEGLAELARLEADEARRRVGRAVVVVGGLCATVFAIGFVVQARSWDKPTDYRDPFALACISAVAATWLTRQVIATRGRVRQTFVIIAAVALSLDVWSARQVPIEKNFTALPATHHDREVRGLAGVPLEARIYDRSYLSYRPGIRLQLRDLGGYEGDPLALKRYAILLDAIHKQPARAGHAAIGWLLEGKPSRGTGLKPTRGGITQVETPAPAVMWAARATVVAGNEQAALDELLAHPPGTTVVVERDRVGASLATRLAAAAAAGAAAAAPAGAVAAAPAGAGGDRPTVAGRLVSLERNRAVAEIDAPAEGVVVVHEAYYPGWRATVDGVPTEVFPANVLFRGVLVPAGHHRIVLSYHAPGYLVTGALSPLAMLVALALILLGARAARGQLGAASSAETATSEDTPGAAASGGAAASAGAPGAAAHAAASGGAANSAHAAASKGAADSAADATAAADPAGSAASAAAATSAPADAPVPQRDQRSQAGGE